MEYYDRQVFTGPPESARETILVAAKSLEKGDWKACKHLIASLPVLQLFPNKDGTYISTLSFPVLPVIKDFTTMWMNPETYTKISEAPLSFMLYMSCCCCHFDLLWSHSLLAIIEMLGKEIQEQGLKTYLFAYGQYYDSLSLDQLCSMFSLDEKGLFCPSVTTNSYQLPTRLSASLLSARNLPPLGTNQPAHS